MADNESKDPTYEASRRMIEHHREHTPVNRTNGRGLDPKQCPRCFGPADRAIQYAPAICLSCATELIFRAHLHYHARIVYALCQFASSPWRGLNPRVMWRVRLRAGG